MAHSGWVYSPLVQRAEEWATLLAPFDIGLQYGWPSSWPAPDWGSVSIAIGLDCHSALRTVFLHEQDSRGRRYVLSVLAGEAPEGALRLVGKHHDRQGVAASSHSPTQPCIIEDLQTGELSGSGTFSVDASLGAAFRTRWYSDLAVGRRFLHNFLQLQGATAVKSRCLPVLNAPGRSRWEIQYVGENLSVQALEPGTLSASLTASHCCSTAAVLELAAFVRVMLEAGASRVSWADRRHKVCLDSDGRGTVKSRAAGQDGFCCGLQVEAARNSLTRIFAQLGLKAPGLMFSTACHEPDQSGQILNGYVPLRDGAGVAPELFDPVDVSTPTLRVCYRPFRTPGTLFRYQGAKHYEPFRGGLPANLTVDTMSAPQRDFTLTRVEDPLLLEKIASTTRGPILKALSSLQDVPLGARLTMFVNSVGPAPQLGEYDAEVKSFLLHLPLFGTHCGRVLTCTELGELCLEHKVVYWADQKEHIPADFLDGVPTLCGADPVAVQFMQDLLGRDHVKKFHPSHRRVWANTLH